jgi:glycosyltransferase involved in cell wall biosynthesis
MIDTMLLLPDWELWIAGEGDLSAQLRERAAASAAMERIRFWGRLRPEALQEVTRQARIGFSLEEDLGLNYRYALPNKLFDYIQCRVPSIVSNLPEMARVVHERGVGLILRQRSPKVLADLVRLLGESPQRYAHWVEACDLAAHDLHWNVEKQRLIELYSI